ncbi:unnamed protein product [Closterium sp. Naga37s-1]|nr:unnamed protein product [Closterium sp. Naga37s-1]
MQGYGRRGCTLSSRLCSLSSLTHLFIECLSPSVTLPSDLGCLLNLRSLSLYGTSLCLPHSLSCLAPCLHSLKLHYSGYSDEDPLHRKLPPCLMLLTSLTSLHLHNMYLPLSPPLAFARLRALRTLRIEYDITFPSHVSFPEDLGQVAALEWLELKYCSISPGLPQSLSAMISPLCLLASVLYAPCSASLSTRAKISTICPTLSPLFLP